MRICQKQICLVSRVERPAVTHSYLQLMLFSEAPKYAVSHQVFSHVC